VLTENAAARAKRLEREAEEAGEDNTTEKPQS